MLAVVGAVGVLGALASCSSEPRQVDDPMMIMGDENQPPQVRQAAIKQARDLAGTDAVAVSAVAESMEEVLSSSRTTPEVRITALTTLLNDKDPAVQSRARDVIKKRLPTEDNSKLIALMCSAAADNAWQDCLPALIRSYARDNEPGKTNADRPERTAISTLAQGQPVEQAVFTVFANPPAQEATYGVNWTVRLQRDAWHVLCRLDPAGTQRAGLVRDARDTNDAGTAALEALRACNADLRAMPSSGDELAWLLSLRNNDKESAKWWGEATAAIAKAPAGITLDLRHAEPVRWAAINQPAWLATTQPELISILRERLTTRQPRERSGVKQLYRETLYGQEESLSWGDCISILAIDDVLRQPGVPSLLWKQATLDLNDQRASYGGAWLPKRGSTSDYLPVVYPPRPAQRRGDLIFVPTDDMLAQCDLALAFYTFHAWKTRNEESAGPDTTDLARSARLRRTETVLTLLGERRMNADVMLPTGVVIDLGVVEAPRE